MPACILLPRKIHATTRHQSTRRVQHAICMSPFSSCVEPVCVQSALHTESRWPTTDYDGQRIRQWETILGHKRGRIGDWWCEVAAACPESQYIQVQPLMSIPHTHSCTCNACFEAATDIVAYGISHVYCSKRDRYACIDCIRLCTRGPQPVYKQTSDQMG